MHKRTKITQIPPMVKYRVWLRDKGKCVLCGRWAPGEPYYGWSNAHYIPRSHGGRGDTDKNILTLCPKCHREYDNTSERWRIRTELKKYLESCYGEIDEKELIYDKWSWTNEQ